MDTVSIAREMARKLANIRLLEILDFERPQCPSILDIGDQGTPIGYQRKAILLMNLSII